MSHIAFIGLGRMGAPMAANLARAGWEVRGFDLVKELREAASRDGVAIVASAREAATGASAVITMLPAGAHVLATLDDIATTLDATSLVIDCSTIDIEDARLVHERVEATGAACVDAPVSGGVAGAQAAALTIMCGGDDAAFGAAQPILAKMGAKILHCGGAGMGLAAKLCNNMILGATMIVTAEAFVLGQKLGLSSQALFEAASLSSGQSWSLTQYCPVPGPVPASPANAGYKPGFMASLMLKDLRLAQAAASGSAVATPLGAMAEQIFALYNALGHGTDDFSGIITMIRGGGQAC
jgi:3-hydroxyisobutyrate dehydrogenase